MSATAGRDDGPMAPGNDSPLPVVLVGDGVAVPVRRRPRAAVPLARRRGVDAGTAGGRRPRQGVPALVLERAPRRRLQVAGGDRRLRGRPGRRPALRRSRADGDDVAIICRNTTEAINHLAYRLRLEPDDVVVTTVAEHHANLLPWARLCDRRFVECGADGTFGVDDVVACSTRAPRPRLLAITGATNVTGWLPPIDEIVDAAHARGVPVLVDAAQLAPHRPLPAAADFLAWSGHKMYAPFGAGVLIGPRATFADGDPFLAGGGAVDLVDLDEVIWTDPPEREEAGSPNVIGAVALDAAIDELTRIGWDAIVPTTSARRPRSAAASRAIPGVRLLGPLADARPCRCDVQRRRRPHALVAARLSAEFGIGVRHGCFCAHPYLMRLLDLARRVGAYRDDVLAGDRREIPGAVRASAGLSTTDADIDRLLAASPRSRPATAAGRVRAGPRHRRLLARRRRARLDRRRTGPGASCARG